MREKLLLGFAIPLTAKLLPNALPASLATEARSRLERGPHPAFIGEQSAATLMRRPVNHDICAGRSKQEQSARDPAPQAL